MKKCTTCQNTLPLSFFNRDKRVSDGCTARCKKCKKKYVQNFLKDPNRLKEHNQRIMKWRKSKPERCLWISAKGRAKKFSVPFTIDVSDIIIPTVCPVLKIPLIPNKGKICQNSPTLDRVIPHLGYVPGNIAVVSARANTIKNNASKEELALVLQWLTEKTNDKI